LKWTKRILTVVAIVAIAAGFAWLLWPQPILVEVAKARIGHMELTVEEEGVNRIREVYVVSAPVAGKVERSLQQVGDHVTAGTTKLAIVRPADPTMLDSRTRLELTAAVEAAKADKDYASASLLQVEKELQFAQNELKRTAYLVGKRVLALNALEKRQLDVDTAAQKLASAKAQLDARSHSLEMAEAKLREIIDTPNSESMTDCCFTVNAPVNGTVLKVAVENEQVVQAGVPLVEIGNPLETEISVDLLSTDAVKVKLGAVARISGWGGSNELKARVKRIDPAASTKISALGIEEQRVHVILEIVDPPARWIGLGHEYRVFASIVIWESENVLQVPLSALFRKDGNWAIFKITSRLAQLTPIKVGEMNSNSAQVLNGLNENETIIVHPSDLVNDGAKVEVLAGEQN
jgi:HlyD family secretion protein